MTIEEYRKNKQHQIQILRKKIKTKGNIGANIKNDEIKLFWLYTDIVLANNQDYGAKNYANFYFQKMITNESNMFIATIFDYRHKNMSLFLEKYMNCYNSGNINGLNTIKNLWNRYLEFILHYIFSDISQCFNIPKCERITNEDKNVINASYELAENKEYWYMNFCQLHLKRAIVHYRRKHITEYVYELMYIEYVYKTIGKNI